MLSAATTSLVVVTCSALVGLGLGAAVPVGLGLGAWLAMSALGASCIAWAALAARSDARPGRAPWLLAACAFAAGIALGPQPHAAPTLPPAGMVRVVARVLEVRYGQGDEARSRITVLHGARVADGAPITPQTELWVHPFPLPEGATVRFIGELSPHARYRNPSPHPSLPGMRETRGYVALPSRDAFEVVQHRLWAKALHALRSHVRARLQRTLDADGAAVACALVLGDPESLDEEDTSHVRASGMAHVFAVSGMHVTLLAGLTMALVSALLLRVPRFAERHDVKRIAAAIGVPLALFIAAFTGGAPSGVRAAVTTAIAWSLAALGRRPHAGAVTAAACLLLTAVDPLTALRPAFLLSIAATAAILAAPSERAAGMPSLAAAAARLSLRTSLATAPIVLWTFGTVSWIGVAANVLLLPLGSALLVLSAAHAACVSLAPWLGGATSWAVCLSSRAFLRACEAFSDASPEVAWPVLDTWQGLAVTLATAALLSCRDTRTRLAAGCAAIALLGLLEVRLRWFERPTGELRVTFLDVGQGDAALIDLPDGRAMLIDAGGNPQGGADPGQRALVPLLRARRRDHLDIVVLSHPHPDHYGGLRAVLAAVSVGELWDTGQSSAEAHMEHTSSAAARVVSDAETRGIRIKDPAQLCGRPRTFAGAVIEVLWPCPRYDPDYDPNDNSLVLRITYGAHSFLFTGDIEAHAEAALTAGAVPLRADVLKVPHHGSRTSSSEALLHAVSPTLAVISAGAVNRFGHPHGEVTDRLQSAVPHVIDLGRSGGTVVTTDGRQLRYRTWAGGVDTTVHRKSARPALQTDTSRRCAPPHIAPETLKRAPADDASASTLNGVAHSK